MKHRPMTQGGALTPARKVAVLATSAGLAVTLGLGLGRSASVLHAPGSTLQSTTASSSLNDFLQRAVQAAFTRR